MSINFEGFLSSLKIMAYGMVGIFIVMLVIYGFVALMNKWSTKKTEKSA